MHLLWPKLSKSQVNSPMTFAWCGQSQRTRISPIWGQGFAEENKITKIGYSLGYFALHYSALVGVTEKLVNAQAVGGYQDLPSGFRPWYVLLMACAGNHERILPPKL